MIQTLRKELASKIDYDTFTLLEKCLNIYESPFDKITGLLIGSKPDEYFAELFLFERKPSHTKDYEEKLFQYDKYTAVLLQELLL